LDHRVVFDLFFALCFLIGVHGTNIIKILIILSLNYTIAKQLGGRKVLPWVTWVFNVGVLFLNEWFDGYQFRDIHNLAAPLVPFYPSTFTLFPCFKLVDHVNGRTHLGGSCIDGKFCSTLLLYD